jgi:hypothetical protein
MTEIRKKRARSPSPRDVRSDDGDMWRWAFEFDKDDFSGEDPTTVAAFREWQGLVFEWRKVQDAYEENMKQ